MGAGQAAQIWVGEGRGCDDEVSHQVNDNMMVIAMIETPIGVANASDIAQRSGRRWHIGRQYRSGEFLRLVRSRIGTLSGDAETDSRCNQARREILGRHRSRPSDAVPQIGI